MSKQELKSAFEKLAQTYAADTDSGYVIARVSPDYSGELAFGGNQAMLVEVLSNIADSIIKERFEDDPDFICYVYFRIAVVMAERHGTSLKDILERLEGENDDPAYQDQDS